MKNKTKIFTVLFVSTAADAHMIEGTQMLKGSIKTKIDVNSVKTTCRGKVDKVKNLMQEDSYGNPAYNVRASLGLDGDDYQRSISVKFEKEQWFNNLFPSGTGTKVSDFDYRADDGSTITIDRDGRIRRATMPFGNRTITCQF